MTSPIPSPSSRFAFTPIPTVPFHAKLTYDLDSLSILSANEDAGVFFACPPGTLIGLSITDLPWMDSIEPATLKELQYDRQIGLRERFRSGAYWRTTLSEGRLLPGSGLPLSIEVEPLELSDRTLMLVSLSVATDGTSSAPPARSVSPPNQNWYEQAPSVIGRLARCLIWYADVSNRADGALHWEVHFLSEEAANEFLPLNREPGQDYATALYFSRLPEDRKRMSRTAQAHIRANQSYSQEYRVRTLNDEIRWLKEDVNIEPVAPGRWRAVGVCTDITERKQAEETQNYIMHSVRCLIWQAQVRLLPNEELVWDVTALSEEAAQLFLPLEIEPGKSYWWALAIHRLEEDRPHTDRLGTESVLANRDYSQEYRERNKYGEIRWLHEDVHVEPVAPGLWHLVGVCTDITDLKRAQEMQQHVTRSARCLIWHGEVVGDPANPTGLDWRLRSLSDDIAEDFLPLDIGEGSNYLVAMTENRLAEDSERIHDPSLSALLADRNYSQEFRVRDKHGKIWWLHEDVSVQRVEWGKWRLVGVCTDITSRKQFEEAQIRSQKLEALGTLAGGIAHDFNNILCAILGNAQLAALELAPDHPVQQPLTEITRASSRSAELIRQILAFSRPQEQNRKPLALESIVWEALSLLRATLPATIEIRTVFAPDVPLVLADSTQVHQVLVNLATNAAYAIGALSELRVQKGYIEIRLEAIEVSREWIGAQSTVGAELPAGRYVRLSISDNGCGMDRAILERIFDPFFTTKSVGEGTGLGLSVVHGIMRSHGGTVTVYSQPGAGATFRLYFPVAAGDVELPAVTPELAPQIGAKHILYVDDEEAIAQFAHRALERLGYRVTVCTNSLEALTLFQARPQGFDGVITDLSMPGLSGFDLASRLLEIRPTLCVVLTSGYVRPEQEAEARRLGIREVLLKPFNLTDLVRALDLPGEPNNGSNGSGRLQ